MFQVGNTSFWSMYSGCVCMSLASICSVQLDIQLAHLEPVVFWVSLESLVSGMWETRDHLSACFKRGRSTAGLAYEVLNKVQWWSTANLSSTANNRAKITDQTHVFWTFNEKVGCIPGLLVSCCGHSMVKDHARILASQGCSSKVTGLL